MTTRPALWQCPECERRFANRNQSHACGRHDLEHHFAGKPPRVRALFDAVAAELPVAERLQTVRDVIDYVVERKPVAPTTTCSTQQTFYIIRRVLRPAAGREHRLTPDTGLAELADRESWPRAWERIRGEGGEAWPASVPRKGWFSDGPETLGGLTLYAVAARKMTRHPEGEPWTRDEVTCTVRQVIWDELGIWKARLDDSFVEDLGID